MPHLAVAGGATGGAGGAAATGSPTGAVTGIENAATGVGQAAVTAGTMALQYLGSNFYNEKNLYKSRLDAYVATRASAQQGLRETYGVQALRQDQEYEALSYSSDEVTRRAAAAASAAIVAAGKGGVSGNTVAALLGDIRRRELEQQRALLMSQRYADAQRQLEGRQAQISAYQIMLQAQSQVGMFNAPQAIMNDIGNVFQLGGGVAGLL